MIVIKRDGRKVDFDPTLIAKAASNAARNDAGYEAHDASVLYEYMLDWAKGIYGWQEGEVTVEDIQDAVEQELMRAYPDVAKPYILYRKKRSDIREGKSKIMEIIREVTELDASESDYKRENANVDANTVMGTMLKYGSTVGREYYTKFQMSPKYLEPMKKGYYWVHDSDFGALTCTCVQTDLARLFKTGFSTGHGFLRPPNDISTYSAQCCIILQAAQNDQWGGQSIPAFDYAMSEGVAKTYITRFCEILGAVGYPKEKDVKTALRAYIEKTEGRLIGPAGEQFIREQLKDLPFDTVTRYINLATERTDRATFQAMEALVHNLNTMHSRAGAQVPFTSINFGTDTSPEGRMVIKNFLLATEAGLGGGETAIFPVSIFKVRKGYNANPGDPNYDLFKLACRVSAKRLFPNFSYMDAPFNAKYLKGSDPDCEVSYMGCRTRVMANYFDKSRETTFGRGNISFSTINLPMLAIEANKDINKFFADLDKLIDLIFGQLLERLEHQGRRKAKNFPTLMGQHIYMDSDKLGPEDPILEAIKHGTLTIGFAGLCETLIALIGKHHGESEEAQELGLKIVKHMHDRCADKSEEMKLNFSLIATPAESTTGRFAKINRATFGEIPGVTDREYITNSFHVPVYFPISAYKKISIEAPYHAYCLAGHISYVEVDGDPSKNLEAFEQLVKFMGEAGCGYASINHPVDRCPVCKYTGIIDDVCPRCGRRDGEGIPLEKYEELKKKYCFC